MMQGCTVYVPKRVDGDASVQSAVISKLQALGAACAKRLGKEVTHVVFLRKLLPSAVEQAQQTAALKELHDRVAKVQPNAFIVSNLWVHATAELGHKANEGDYVIARPTEASEVPFLSLKRTPEGVAARRRPSTTPKRAGAVPLPVDAFQFDVDSTFFSSSQQLQDASDADATHMGRKRRQSAPLAQVPRKVHRVQRSSTPGAAKPGSHAEQTDNTTTGMQHSATLHPSALTNMDTPAAAACPETEGKGSKVVCIDLTGITPPHQPDATAADTFMQYSEQKGTQRRHLRAKRSVMWADNLTPEASPAAGLVLMPPGSAYSDPTPATGARSNHYEGPAGGHHLAQPASSMLKENCSPVHGLAGGQCRHDRTSLPDTGGKQLHSSVQLCGSPLQAADQGALCMSPPSFMSLLHLQGAPAHDASPALFPHSSAHQARGQSLSGPAPRSAQIGDSPLPFAAAAQPHGAQLAAGLQESLRHNVAAETLTGEQPGVSTPRLHSSSSIPKGGTQQQPHGVSAAARLLLARRKLPNTPSTSPHVPALAPALRGAVTPTLAARSSGGLQLSARENSSLPGASQETLPVSTSKPNLVAEEHSDGRELPAVLVGPAGEGAVVLHSTEETGKDAHSPSLGCIAADRQPPSGVNTDRQGSNADKGAEPNMSFIDMAGTRKNQQASPSEGQPSCGGVQFSSSPARLLQHQGNVRALQAQVVGGEQNEQPSAPQHVRSMAARQDRSPAKQRQEQQSSGTARTRDQVRGAEESMGDYEMCTDAHKHNVLPAEAAAAVTIGASTQHRAPSVDEVQMECVRPGPDVCMEWCDEGTIQMHGDGVISFEPAVDSTSVREGDGVGPKDQNSDQQVRGVEGCVVTGQNKPEAASSSIQPHGALRGSNSLVGREQQIASCAHRTTAPKVTKYKQTLLNIPRLKVGASAASSEGALSSGKPSTVASS